MNEIKSPLTPEVRGMLLVFIGGIFWGFSGACGEYIFQNKGVGANFLVPYRLFFAGIFIIIYYILNGKSLDIRVFKNKTDFMYLISYAVLGILLTQYSYFYGIELSNAAVATVIQYTAPVFIVLIVCHNERRKPTKFETIALACVVIGTMFLATNGDFTKLVLSPYALFICFLSAIGTIFYNMLPIGINKKYDPVLMLGYAMVIVGIFMCFYNNVFSIDVKVDFELILAMLGVILFGTVFAFGFYMLGLREIGPAKASLISSIEPISAAFFSYVWLKTSFGIWQMLGFVLIMLAILLIYFTKKA